MSPIENEACAAEAPFRWGGEAPDEVVLERVRAGETALYEVLVRRHDPRLRGVARRVLSNEADVDEVIQEAHCNAFCSLRQFTGRSSFSIWLTRIAIHAALSRLRNRAHLRELTSSYSDYDPLETATIEQRIWPGFIVGISRRQRGHERGCGRKIAKEVEGRQSWKRTKSK